MARRIECRKCGALNAAGEVCRCIVPRGLGGKLVMLIQGRIREERRAQRESGSRSEVMHAYAANRLESLLLAMDIPVDQSNEAITNKGSANDA